MENNSAFLRVVCLAACLLFEHCAHSHAPLGWLSGSETVPLDPYGAWIEVETDSGRIDGEFIAVSSDSVFVADTVLHVVGRTAISSARVFLYNSNDVSAGLILGPLLTISNGVLLIFTAPMWLIGGSIAAVSRSHDPLFDYPKDSFEQMSRYARFPRGLPEGIDRSRVVMKSPENK